MRRTLEVFTRIGTGRYDCAFLSPSSEVEGLYSASIKDGWLEVLVRCEPDGGYVATAYVLDSCHGYTPEGVPIEPLVTGTQVRSQYLGSRTEEIAQDAVRALEGVIWSEIVSEVRKQRLKQQLADWLD